MKREFIVGDVYHICNRGVDKREIFHDDEDNRQFIESLREFNNWGVVYNFSRSVKGLRNTSCTVEQVKKPVVDVLAFCLMRNHFHLLLRSLVENGISLFMKKVAIGHANRFNKKYGRSGTLFQGRYVYKHIDTPEYFEYVLSYIHANALDLAYPTWREEELADAERALEFLENYRWSSFPDYVGGENFPSMTQRGYLQERLTGGAEEYRRKFANWLRDFEHHREMFELH